MIDTLIQHLEKVSQSSIGSTLGIYGSYALVTLHRPSNVDSKAQLSLLFECLVDLARQFTVVFPIHPRTRNNAANFGLLEQLENDQNIILSEPLGYLDFLHLTSNASVVITDSGGIQEETTYLGIPCVTLRENTERPVTVTIGSNYLIGTQKDNLMETVQKILSGQGKKTGVPPLWDGRAGERIVENIVSHIQGVVGSQ